MRKVALLICVVTFSFASCQKNDYTFQKETKSQQKTEQLSTSVDTTGFASDSLTQSFIAVSTEIKQSDVDTSAINRIIADDTVTDAEMNPLAHALGFNSSNDLSDYITRLNDVIDSLNGKYHLNELDTTQLKGMFKGVMLSYLNNLAQRLASKGAQPSYLSGSNHCAVAYAGCVSLAYAFEASGFIGCNGGDIFPPIAVLCIASVVVATQFALSQCSADYKTCEGNSVPPSSGKYLASAIRLTFYDK